MFNFVNVELSKEAAQRLLDLINEKLDSTLDLEPDLLEAKTRLQSALRLS